MDKLNAIWITGASTGIGKALAIKFANENHFVIGSSRRKAVIEKLKFQISNYSNIKAIKNDVSNPKSVENCVNSIIKKYKIDCLINNAGISSFKPFIDNSLEEIEEIINTNLKGSIYTIKSVLPHMIKNGSGVIINILSVASTKIFKNSSIYSASKAGLETFTKVLREELRENNIRIINIYPGATATEIWPQKSLEMYSDKMMSPNKLAELIYDLYINSNELSPEEIVVRPITGDL